MVKIFVLYRLQVSERAKPLSHPLPTPCLLSVYLPKPKERRASLCCRVSVGAERERRGQNLKDL